MSRFDKIKALAGSKLCHALLGVLVSLAVLIYVGLSVEWHLVLEHLRTINYLALFPVLALLIVHYYLRALRWRYLLPAPHDAPVRPLYDAIMVGNFASYVFPLRAGEFIRPWLLTRDYKCSFASAFVSVVVERFFDLSIVLMSFAGVVFLVPGMPDWVFSGAMALSTLAGAILVFIVLGSMAPDFIARVISFFIKPLPAGPGRALEKFLLDLLRGVAVLKSGGNLFRVVLLSLLVWATCYGSFYTFFWLFNIESSWLICVSLGVIVALAVAAPSAPGFIGVYEGSLVAGMQLFGLSAELGAAYALVTHFILYVIFVGYAIWYLWRNSMGISDLRRAGQR